MAKTRIPFVTCRVLVLKSTVLGAGELASLVEITDATGPIEVTVDIPAKTETKDGVETVVEPLTPDLGEGVELLEVVGNSRTASGDLPEGAPKGSLAQQDGSILAPQADGSYKLWTPETKGLAAAAVHNAPVVNDGDNRVLGDLLPTGEDWAALQKDKSKLVAHVQAHKVVVRNAAGEEVDPAAANTTKAMLIESIETADKARAAGVVSQ